jgi:hypothetical protein
MRKRRWAEKCIVVLWLDLERGWTDKDAMSRRTVEVFDQIGRSIVFASVVVKFQANPEARRECYSADKADGGQTAVLKLGLMAHGQLGHTHVVSNLDLKGSLNPRHDGEREL